MPNTGDLKNAANKRSCKRVTIEGSISLKTMASNNDVGAEDCRGVKEVLEIC